MQENLKQDNVIRLAVWLAEHPEVQRRLCDNEYEVNPEEFIEIMELLEKNEFYEMILILAIKNKVNATLERAFSRLLMENLGKNGTKQMCKDLKDIIKEEIKLKEIRTSEF